MKHEDIIKKAEEIMKQGDFGLLSDSEVTTHVAVETAEWAEKAMLDKMCKFLKGCQRFVVDTTQYPYFDYKKAIESLKQSMLE